MTIQNFFASRLTSYRQNCTISDGEVHIERPNHRPLRVTFPSHWEEAFWKYQRARSLSFNDETRRLQYNASYEAHLTALSSPLTTYLPTQDTLTLTDLDGSYVTLGPASYLYSLAHFASPAYDRYFQSLAIQRMFDSAISERGIDNFLWRRRTILYKARGRATPTDLAGIAEGKMRASLFKWAVELDLCFDLWRPPATGQRVKVPVLPDTSERIPRVNYDEHAVTYYKIAKSTLFPGQSFLAYFNTLEYFFLTTAEADLHTRLATVLNDTRFCANTRGLDKIVSLIRSQDARNDETELLRNVIVRFVKEKELLSFISSVERESGSKIYTSKRTAFGENLQIPNIEEQVLGNTARALKIIRNAIVHSSDRYKREDRYIPLGESENVVVDYIPLIRFIAEKAIYGSATPVR